MRGHLRICAALLLGLSAAALAVTPEPGTAAAAAQDAASKWLALIDHAEYAESWTQAASLFRAGITQAKWQDAAASARTPFGPLKSRHLQSAVERHELPGAPDGDYVVIQFATAFAGKASALETVTAMKDTDGAWRIAGYYIK